jgi:hypothetical protein
LVRVPVLSFLIKERLFEIILYTVIEEIPKALAQDNSGGNYELSWADFVPVTPMILSYRRSPASLEEGKQIYPLFNSAISKGT